MYNVAGCTIVLIAADYLLLCAHSTAWTIWCPTMSVSNAYYDIAKFVLQVAEVPAMAPAGAASAVSAAAAAPAAMPMNATSAIAA